MRSLFKYLPAIAVIAAVGLSLMVEPANAGMVLRQKADGAAEWVKTDSRAGNTYEVGRKEYTFRFENISSASSEYVVIPVSGKVTAVYSVIHGAITGADAIIAIADGVSAASFTTLTISNSGSAAGDIDSSTGLSEVINETAQGPPFVLTVGTNGESTNDVDATITIVVDPI